MALETLGSAGGKWLWDQFGKQIVEKAFGDIKKKWEEFKWDDAETLYLLNLREQHNTTRLLGYPKPIKIDETFTDVYILDKLTAHKRFNVDELISSQSLDKQPKWERETKKTNILRLVEKEKKLYILGKPGAGKTTLLKYIIVCACDGKINKTPIYVSLKEWEDSELELIPFLVQQFDICDFPDAQAFIEKLLTSENSLVMFDGLDEVNQEGYKRARMTRRLSNFAKKYRNAHIYITCRIAASDYSFTQFNNVEIADFDERQVAIFSKKWFQDNPAMYDRFLSELRKPENSRLNDLTKTPLLLALLCLVFDDIHQFPARRVDLYKETLDVWLRKWDSSRDIIRDDIYKHLPPARREQMLSRIAAQNFEKGVYFIGTEVLASQIEQYISNLDIGDNETPPKGETILKAIESQHGILVERAFGIYSFSHTTFQEFLTARYIVANAAKGTIEKLAEKYLLDGRWHEVFLMTTSLLDDAEILFDASLKNSWEVLSQSPRATKLIQWATKQSIQLGNEAPIIRVGLVYRVIDKIFDRYLGALASIGDEHLKGEGTTFQRTYDPKLLDELTKELANDKRADKIDILRTQLRDFMFELDKFKHHRTVDILESHMIKELHIGLIEVDESDIDILRKFLQANHLLFECLSLASLPNRNAITTKLFRSSTI